MEGAATTITLMKLLRPVVVAALGLLAATALVLAPGGAVTVRYRQLLELRLPTQAAVQRWATTPTAGLGLAAAELGTRPEAQTLEAVAALPAGALALGLGQPVALA